MARRDNQGIQIAMIVFILTTLVFMLTTYFGYSRATTLDAELEKTKSDLSSAQSQMRSSETLATSLKSAIGMPPGSDASTAQTLIEDLRKKYGAGLGEGDEETAVTLEEIIQNRVARVTELSQQVAAANTQIGKLRSDLDSAKKVAATQLAEANKQRAKAQEEYNLVNQEKSDYIAQNDARNKALVDQSNKAKAELDRAKRESAAAVALAQQERDDANRRTRLKQDEINEFRSDTPDRYDGQIIGVVAATSEVMLNRGSADGVMPKMTFGVYDATDNNVRTAKKKVSIEVTRILDDHRSLARITDRHVVTPPVKDDYIYSPLWSPGERLGLALVGEMDIDKDGLDDRDYIKSLIKRNAGRVDAEDVGESVVGEMSVGTRYIVVGEGQMNKVQIQMMNDAKMLTIEQMSVSELLELMSPPGRARSLIYGAGKVGDFAPTPREGGARVSTGTTSFRKRTPTPVRRRPARNF